MFTNDKIKNERGEKNKKKEKIYQKMPLMVVLLLMKTWLSSVQFLLASHW